MFNGYEKRKSNKKNAVKKIIDLIQTILNFK